MSADGAGKNTEAGKANQNGDVVQPGVTRRSFLVNAAATGIVLTLGPPGLQSRQSATPEGTDPLERAFLDPPDASKAWAWWWWLDGASTREGITADLETMKQQGILGVVVYDAGTGGPNAPKGPLFMSAEWRENFRFAVQEAARLGIELGVNLCSGWDAGGPWVTRDEAIKDFVWKETVIEGPGRIDQDVPRHVVPPSRNPFVPTQIEEAIDWYRDIAVLACREVDNGVWGLAEIQDLTSATQDGRLRWDAPQGRWSILRIGYVVRKQITENAGPQYLGFHQVKNSSWPAPSWEIDPMSGEAMDEHFAATAAKLVQDAGPLTGKTFKYTQIDSWELGVPSWTAKFIEEFRHRRGYDPTRYLPALADKTLDTPEVTERFKWDYRRTVADLVAENYYGRLAKLSHEHGLLTHTESGGPFYAHWIDAMECEGTNDIPMAEFWTWRVPLGGFDGKPQLFEQGVSTPFFRSADPTFPAMTYGDIRQAASAAHVYGKPISQAEAFTSFISDWSEDPYFLKSFGDRAFCLGLTRNVLSFFVQQSTLTDKPGYEWVHVGTHFDRNITWWPMSRPWLTYLARCQHLLRQGTFVADVLYFAGEAVPNFVLRDRKPIAGFDFDVINAQALLTRAASQNGKVSLPGGMSYRYLVLPEGAAERITPTVLGKMRDLVEGGVTLVGARPKHSLGLTNYPQSEEQVKMTGDALWGTEGGKTGARSVGKGRVIWGKALEEVIEADKVQPDLELRRVPQGADLDWIHRHDGQSDIYFLANLTEQEVEIEAVFRVSGKAPELWDAVTGETRNLAEFRAENARTAIPLHFAPRQSWFIVFRKTDTRNTTSKAKNFPPLADLVTLSGTWEVAFDEQWGGPAKVVFQRLDDWSERPEDGIRYYSGTAIYRKTFDLPAKVRMPLYLDLGEVKNVARVRLNGKDLGVVWTSPWRVAINIEQVRENENLLEIEVANLWPNRLIGDGRLPKEQRRTKTNVRTYDTPVPADLYFCDSDCAERKKTGVPAKLLKSGLLDPVKLTSEA